MKAAQIGDEKILLDYLAKDIANCLYIYADISKYGFKDQNLKVWYDKDADGIRAIVMKYHNNFQIYSSRAFDKVEEIVALINEYKPYGVAGRTELIASLEKEFSDRYNVEYGVIYRGKDIKREKILRALEECEVKIELASEDDAEAIAKLICMDDELGSVYTVESFAEELRERIHTGMGRSYIIRDGEEIVAHNATYAEGDMFVVISGLMVHPDYRDTDYAYWIDLKSSLEFQEEGKDRYFFALDKKIIRWHKNIKTPIATEYGKLSLKEK